jgi:hypothetical protein
MTQDVLALPALAGFTMAGVSTSGGVRQPQDEKPEDYCFGGMTAGGIPTSNARFKPG